MDRRVVEIIARSIEQPARPFPLHVLARGVQLSKRRVQQLFRQHTGKTFTAQRRELRMKRARVLLLKSFNPIKRIAIQTGFRTAAAFCREFRKANGCTPTQFRQNFTFGK